MSSRRSRWVRALTVLLVALAAQTLYAAEARAQPDADLALTKTDGVTTAVAGGSVTYTITASNAGPSNAGGATVADTLPAVLTGTWTCVGAGGGTCTASGSGNINDTVNLPTGASVTYTVSAAITAARRVGLSNTATVSAPAGVTDPTPGNNSATDTDTLLPQADLAVTKTDGVTSAVAGGSVTYTITASNAGPSNAPGATVVDVLSSVLTGTWTCAGAGGGTCTASGSGNINDTVNLPAVGSVTYTVSAAVDAGASGSLSNTATVSAPGGVTDPAPGNNSTTDTDTLLPQADLAVTKTDGVTSAVAGGSVTYTITASNAGPSDASGATVADALPADLSGAWTCVGAGGATCTASGSGDINDTVNLPAGGSVTYTVSAAVAASAAGSLSNTATVGVPVGVPDPAPGNNSATDTDTLLSLADLAMTKTDGVTSAVAGGSVTYTITASNAGPSNASGATVADALPAALTGTWTCVGAGGGTCTASGSGNVNDTVDLPAGGSVTYTVSAAVAASASGSLSNTATVSAPAGATDPTPGNNSATDTDTVSALPPVPVPPVPLPVPVPAPVPLLREPDGAFLCYSRFQVDPGVWPAGEATALLARGYWRPTAVLGTVSATRLGPYSLVCNPSTQARPIEHGFVDDGGTRLVGVEDPWLGLYPIADMSDLAFPLASLPLTVTPTRAETQSTSRTRASQLRRRQALSRLQHEDLG